MAGVAFKRGSGSLLKQIILGYGYTTLVLIFAGIAACVFGCPCCAPVKRRAADGARRATATPLGGAMTAALTKTLVRRDRVVGGGGGGNTDTRPPPPSAADGAARSLINTTPVTAQQQHAASL